MCVLLSLSSWNFWPDFPRYFCPSNLSFYLILNSIRVKIVHFSPLLLHVQTDITCRFFPTEFVKVDTRLKYVIWRAVMIPSIERGKRECVKRLKEHTTCNENSFVMIKEPFTCSVALLYPFTWHTLFSTFIQNTFSEIGDYFCSMYI